MELGVHASLHVNCHHQTILAKFDLQIYYPPPYKRVVWHYKQAHLDHISKDIRGFNWENSFPNKAVLRCIDYQDPPWINNKVKKAIQEKNQLFSRVKPNIDNVTLLKKLNLDDSINTAKRQSY